MDILKYIIPAFIVLITAYLLIDRLMSNDEKRKKYELASKKNTSVIPMRIRAYERIMLLLERTNPGNIIPTIIRQDMTCLDFQTKLILTLRSEFEHNYAQQIYVSDELWLAVISTQENIIKLINTASSRFQPDDPALKLAESIITIYAETENNPTDIAIDILKDEVRSQFFA